MLICQMNESMIAYTKYEQGYTGQALMERTQIRVTVGNYIPKSKLDALLRVFRPGEDTG